MISPSHSDPKRAALKRRPLYLPLAIPVLLGAILLVLIWWTVQAWGDTTTVLVMRCGSAPDAAVRSAQAAGPQGLLVTPAALDSALPVARKLDLTVIQVNADQVLDSRDGGHWVACVASADLRGMGDAFGESAAAGTRAWLVVLPALGRRSVTPLDFSP